MKLKFSLSLLLIFISALSWSQGQRVTGVVTRQGTTEGLPGVTVAVKGGRASTSTDTAGRFSITVPNTNSTLVFTSVGFARREVPVAGQSALEVVLTEEASTMNDVVVIGYQTVRRRDVLASVSSVGAKELRDVPVTNAAEALNGRLAGVTATTAEGEPGADVRIRVRGGMSITGSNEPLYVIDGVQVESGLQTVSPQDIQSIDVLKDAAATAIYGARGANGVIIITTKSGRPGRTVVGYNGFVGIKKLARKLDVLSPYDFVTYQAERARSQGTVDSTSFARNFGTTWDTLNVYKDVDPVDWQREVFGRTGIQHTHNLTASGGNKKITYNFGYTYNGDKAILLNSNYKRHLLNLKGDYKITDNLRAGISTRYTLQNVYGSGVSSEGGASLSRLRNTMRYRPFLSDAQDVDENDPLNDPLVGNGLILVNPVSLTNAEYRRRTTNAYNVTVNAQYTILKDVTFKSTFGYDRNQRSDRQFFDTISPASVQMGRMPVANLDTTETTILTNSNVLTYNLRGKSHSFDFLLGQETYDLRTKNNQTQIRDLPYNIGYDEAFKNQSRGTVVTGFPRPYESRFTQLSFFGRIGYNYKDKYLLSGNLRYDGASKFAAGNRWGTFPAGSIAWRVKKEKFMEDVDFITDLKLRFGFGTMGNNRIRDYLYQTIFSGTGDRYYGLGGQPLTAYWAPNLANEILTWESTVNRNWGLDVSLLKNRLDLSVDYYINSSKDLLLQVNIDPTYGYSIQQQNVGRTQNKGIELQLNGTLVRKPNGLNWTASFNISRNNNKLVQLGPNQSEALVGGMPATGPRTWGVSGQPADYILRIGESVGSMYGLVTEGFYKVDDFNYSALTGAYTLKPGVVSNVPIIGTIQPGSIKFKDLNGDGVVDLNNDRTIIGNPNPAFYGGLNQQLSYKSWDASVFVNFMVGQDVYNANKLEFTNAYSINSNMLDVMKDRWRTIDPTTGETLQRVTNGVVYGVAPDRLAAANSNAKIWQPLISTGAFTPHSWAIEDGSFLRINNVTIGYTLPVKSVRAIHMSKLRFYFTANNLAMFTKYTGYDPEVSVRNDARTPNLDYSAYPKSRTYIFGLNASF